jgi:hypothetical protein
MVACTQTAPRSGEGLCQGRRHRAAVTERGDGHGRMYYHWYMSMKRTNVYADPDDLAIIKEAAARRGISEAEIIRQGIHLAAMANRVWDEPLFSRTFEGSGRTPAKEEVRNAVADSVRRESEPRDAV